MCLPFKWRRWRPIPCWYIHCTWRNWGTSQMRKSCKGLSPAHGHHLCHQSELPTKFKIHIWSFPEALSWAWCPETFTQGPVTEKETYDLRVCLTFRLKCRLFFPFKFGHLMTKNTHCVLRVHIQAHSGFNDNIVKIVIIFFNIGPLLTVKFVAEWKALLPL